MKTNKRRYSERRYLDYLRKGSLVAGIIAAHGMMLASQAQGAELATGKAITAQSHADVYMATNANDGNQDSYWESQNYAFPQTLTVDLGAVSAINQVVLKLPAPWGSRTQTLSVLGSTDGGNYFTIAGSAGYSFDPVSNNVVTISFAETDTRYVRLNITGNTGWSAGQISEIEVHGVANQTPLDAFNRIEAESYTGMNGVQTEATTDAGGGQNLGWIDNGDWLLFQNVDFGSGAGSVDARVASDHAGGTIEFRTGSPTGSLIGSVDVTYTGGWQNWVTESAGVNAEGVQDVYLVFKGTATGGLFNLNWIQFSADDGISVPAAPQNLASSNVTTSSVSLSWDSVGSADGYDVLRDGSVIHSTSSTSYQDDGLAENTSYTYTVRAYNEEGASGPSNAVTVTTDESTGPGGPSPDAELVSSGRPATSSSALAAHGTANATDGNQATYWESNTNAFPQTLTVDLGSTHYVSQVVLKLPNEQAWATRTQTLSIQGSSDGTSFNTIVGSAGYVFDPDNANTVTVTFPETTARYVRINVTDNTGWAAAQVAEFEVYGYPDPVPPATPQDLAVAGATSTTVYLTWDASELADGYEVLRDGQVIADVTSNSYQDTGLTPSTSYSYSVRAYNEFGDSAASSSVTGTTNEEGQDPVHPDRGANMPYVIQQAEDANVGGGAVVVGPNRIIGDIAGEASGRRAVTLNNTGDYVEFTTEAATNTLVTRFSIPDAPGGGGITATLSIYVNGQFEETIELTSKHAWLYGDETNPNNNPGSGPARHIYDEANIMFDHTIPAGSTIRLQKDAGNTSQYAIDFISLEQVAPIPNPNPGAYIEPNGFTHQAVQAALDQARMGNAAGVYLPPGTYQTSHKFQVYGKPLEVIGAGPWYTRFETPEGQSNTDAGFSVNSSANGSTFANFAFFGNYVDRINGPGKVFDFSNVSNMTIDNIWVEHQVCMFWGASVHDSTIKNSRMRNLFADGLNFTNGSSGNHVVNNEARTTGDDSFALFAATDNGGGIVQNNVYENLTAMTPWRAAGLGVYGGQGNTFRNIHVEDTLVYSGVTISSLDFGYPFTGFQSNPTTNFEDITILRSGGNFWNNQVFPALWMFSASKSFQGIRINDLDIIDPTYHGIMFQTNYVGGNYQNVFQDTILTDVTISGAHTHPDYPNRSGFGIWANPMPEPGQGPAVGTVEFRNLTLINNTVNIQNDSPDFTIRIIDGPDPLPVPQAPQNVTVTDVTTSSVSLSWSAANGADGYDILRDGSVIASTAQTAFQDNGLAANTTYAYAVRAFNENGNSDLSSSVSATTDEIIDPDNPDDPPDPDPTNVSSGRTPQVSSELSFAPASNALDGNQATYWESTNNAFPQAFTVDLGSTHYVSQVVLKLPNDSAWATRTQTLSVLGSADGSNFSDIVPSDGYVFDPNNANTVTISFPETTARYVRLNITGNDGWPAAQLSEVEIWGHPDPVPPTTPQNLSVMGETSSSIFLAWQGSGLADGYKVLRDGAEVADIISTTFEDTGLQPLTSYTYSVRAYNEFGSSTLSNSVTGTTTEYVEPPEPPEPADRGATMPYDRYETEQANYGGGAALRTAPDFDQLKTASEASGQAYIALPNDGSYAEWTIRDGEGGAGVTMRFTMPDSGDGMGLDGSLDVYVNDSYHKTIDLTSYYNYQYFTPGGGHPSDTPGGGNPLFRFDEVHWKLNAPLQPGDTIRIQKGNGDALEYGVDFLEIEAVPNPISRPANSVSVTGFGGAVPNDGMDDLAAFEATVAEAVASGRSVYIPPGTFHLGNMWVVGSLSNMIQDIDIMGAGIWHTNLQFTNPNAASGGISFRVEGRLEFSHIYMNSMLRSRYHQQAVYKGFMDNFGSNSYIHDVWVEHFECGFWVGDYAHTPAIIADGLLIENSRIRNNLADGVNFAQGTSNSTVRNSSIRNNGDDGLAVWTSNVNGAPPGVNNTFEYNTIEFQWRAAGIAFFGGSGHKATNNVVIDGIGSSGFRMNTVFPGYHFQNNTGIVFADSTLIRTGTSLDTWGGERGAIDLEASTDSIRNLTISNIEIYDTQRDAVQIGYNGGFENVVFNNILIDGTGLDGETTSRFAGPHLGAAIYVYTNNGSATFNNLTTSNIAYPDTNFVQPGFNLIIQ